MKTTLIAGTSFIGQSAAKLRNKKVQRLDQMIVHLSRWKWVVSKMDKDIV